MNIILIGAGQLGSRHLQSMANVDISNVNIDVVDPYQVSLDIAKERYLEVSKRNQTINFFKSTNDTKNSEYDIAIVATNSNIRAIVVKELLSVKVVKNMILEKVLFQKEHEYYEIEKLINDKQIKTWVNHPKRSFPFYKTIKEKLQNAKEINFSVSVGNWGLACNVLHLLDTFEYLCQKSLTQIELDKLDKKVISAKRESYLEINGLLTGSLGNAKFQIKHMENNSPIQILISSDVCNIFIDEKNGKYSVSMKENNWKSEVTDEKIVYFQSELTKSLIVDINLKGICDLPTYEESMKLHLKFILPLQEFINKYSDKKYDFCPIT